MDGEQAEKAPEATKAIFANNLAAALCSPKRPTRPPIISAPQGKAWSGPVENRVKGSPLTLQDLGNRRA
jgi:hypothetical protein